MFAFFRKKTKESAKEPAEDPVPDPDPGLIVPRVRNVAWVEEVKRLVPHEVERPVIDVLVGDIYLLYGLDEGDTYRMLKPASVKELGLQVSQLRHVARQNLFKATRTLRSRMVGPLIEFADDDDLVAPTLLMTSFGLELETQLGGALVGIFPYAYSGFVAKADPEGIAAIRERMSDEMPLSGLLYQCRDGHWSVRES